MKHKICPVCGARNAEGALWCGQCYAMFGTDEAESEETLPAEQLPLRPPLPDTPSGPVWTCTVCGTEHSIEESTCPVCGTSMFAAFVEPEPMDPKQALVRGLLIPGFGHGVAGQGLLGGAIGLLVLVSALFGVLLIVGGAAGGGWGLGLAAVATWLVSAMDAFHLARGETSEVLLRPRVVTVLAGVVVAFVIIVALAAQGKVQP